MALGIRDPSSGRRDSAPSRDEQSARGASSRGARAGSTRGAIGAERRISAASSSRAAAAASRVGWRSSVLNRWFSARTPMPCARSAASSSAAGAASRQHGEVLDELACAARRRDARGDAGLRERVAIAIGRRRRVRARHHAAVAQRREREDRGAALARRRQQLGLDAGVRGAVADHHDVPRAAPSIASRARSR